MAVNWLNKHTILKMSYYVLCEVKSNTIWHLNYAHKYIEDFDLH